MAKNNQRKTIYVVVGNGRCGKSSLIRCLTGVARTMTTPVILINQLIIDISVWVRSAQEAGKSPAQVLRELRAMRGSIGLLSLRLNGYNRQPNANAYLQILRLHFNVIIYTIPMPIIPSNANAAIARGQWGWL